jgi:hypothetical protein
MKRNASGQEALRQSEKHFKLVESVRDYAILKRA